MKNKISYLLLLISLNIGYFVTIILRIFSFLLKKSNPPKDLILFPYAQKGSDGYTRRFEEYFKFLDQDNISYKVCDLDNEAVCIDYLESSPPKRYFMYHKIFWTRLYQVLSARNYKSAFIHRGLFVFYPDNKNPYLEKLLRKLCTNITIDFWDSVWIHNSDLIKNTVKYTDKISAANDFIMQHFKNEKAEKILFPIGLNLDNYIAKTNYELSKPIKLFYTGLPYNVEIFLKGIEPILKTLSSKFDLKLVIVSRARTLLNDIDIEYHYFDDTTFFKILCEADIGLYMVEDNEESRGKTAMKVLDYMSTGLPTIASPIGITPHASDNNNVLFANSNEDWAKSLESLINNIDERKRLGTNSIRTINEHHSLLASYKVFKNVVGIN